MACSLQLPRTSLHQLDHHDDALGVLAHIAEAVLHQQLELGPLGALGAADDVNVVLRQLERRRLEADAAGRDAEHEAEVDVCGAHEQRSASSVHTADSRIRRPSPSMRMLPLCRSLIWSR